MRIQSYELSDAAKTVVPLGYEGENLATRIEVDVSPWLSEYPAGAISIIAKNALGDVYPAASRQQGNKIIWDVLDSDTVAPGPGAFELNLLGSSQEIVKSAMFRTTLVDALGDPTGPAPDPMDDWMRRLASVEQGANNAAKYANEQGSIASDIIGTLQVEGAAVDSAMLGGKLANYYDPQRIFALASSDNQVTNLHPSIDWSLISLSKRGATVFASIRLSLSQDIAGNDPTPLFQLPTGFAPATGFLIRTQNEPYAAVDPKDTYLSFYTHGSVTMSGDKNLPLISAAGITLQFCYLAGGDV